MRKIMTIEFDEQQKGLEIEKMINHLYTLRGSRVEPLRKYNQKDFLAALLRVSVIN